MLMTRNGILNGSAPNGKKQISAMLQKHWKEYSYFWLAGNEGMGKEMETTIQGYIGTSIAFHSVVPS